MQPSPCIQSYSFIFIRVRKLQISFNLFHNYYHLDLSTCPQFAGLHTHYIHSYFHSPLNKQASLNPRTLTLLPCHCLSPSSSWFCFSFPHVITQIDNGRLYIYKRSMTTQSRAGDCDKVIWGVTGMLATIELSQRHPSQCGLHLLLDRRFHSIRLVSRCRRPLVNLSVRKEDGESAPSWWLRLGADSKNEMGLCDRYGLRHNGSWAVVFRNRHEDQGNEGGA